MADIIFFKTKKSKEIRDFYTHVIGMDAWLDVDQMYTKHTQCVQNGPKINDTYTLYHFFARDPEDRTIEFQAFLHRLKEWPAADTRGVW